MFLLEESYQEQNSSTLRMINHPSDLSHRLHVQAWVFSGKSTKGDGVLGKFARRVGGGGGGGGGVNMMESCKTEKYTYQKNSATLSLSSEFQIKIFTYAEQCSLTNEILLRNDLFRNAYLLNAIFT